MSKRDELRRQRAGTVINRISVKQEKEVMLAIRLATSAVEAEYNFELDWKVSVPLQTVISDLRRKGYKDIPFDQVLPSSAMKPDGGILSIVDREGHLYPILIAEVKNQGTNDIRELEGKPRQAMGNAIERLGKNVIGFRTWLLPEDIFPFICFGYGYDFHEASSIRDRVKTINMFGPLSTTTVKRLGPRGEFQWGSFFFRQAKWTVEEMAREVLPVMRFSIDYYVEKYGAETFRERSAP